MQKDSRALRATFDLTAFGLNANAREYSQRPGFVIRVLEQDGRAHSTLGVYDLSGSINAYGVVAQEFQRILERGVERLSRDWGVVMVRGICAA
jgi:hypothetical protein